MASEKHPWMKFYPSDWRGSARLKSCSAGARAVLVEMMCIMHDAEPYGHLVIADNPVDDAELARQSGLPPKQVALWRQELETKGVIERNASGVVFNPRMVRDEQTRSRRASGGRLGGNPSLKIKDKQKVNLPDNHEGYTHGRARAEPDARSQILEETSSVAIATGGKPPIEEITAPANPKTDSQWKATFAILVREHFWLGNKPPARVVEREPDWDLSREVTMGVQWAKDYGGWETVCGLLPLWRTVLHLPADQPLSCLHYHGKQRRSQINEVLQHYRRLQEKEASKKGAFAGLKVSA